MEFDPIDTAGRVQGALRLGPSDGVHDEHVCIQGDR
jgi:hypothetical protein